MVAYVGGVVTSAAGARKNRQIQVVVEPRDVGDLNRLGIEQNLAAGNTGALAGRIVAIIVAVLAVRVRIQPRIKQVKNRWRKRNEVRVSPERIVDTHKECRHGLQSRSEEHTSELQS